MINTTGRACTCVSLETRGFTAGRSTLPFIALLICWPVIALAEDTESWSDPSLPVRQKLALWLDAQAQPRAYLTNGLLQPRAGEAIGTCFDSSGNRRHAGQRHVESQPTFFSRGQLAALRFDGRDDALEQSGVALHVDTLTVFIVAAPRTNTGGFRALFALNQAARRDYESGLTIDLGPLPSTRFETLNIEGKGFIGAPNLMADAHPFGGVHVVECTIGAGARGVSCSIDGKPQKSRDRQASRMEIDEATIGARSYSNEPRPQHIQGFFHGEIAEILVYESALDEASRRDIRAYLERKHARLSAALRAGQAASVPPTPVQLLVPGFEAYDLPVSLKNINNLRYRGDGKLVALGYDGNIYLLSDTNGDGLEDRVQSFWENRGRLRAPIGMALTKPGDPRGQGVFVTSKGKCSLIVDSDGDDTAEREVVLAEGWQELASHGVDALGVAVADDGSVYFGLGSANFTNAYLLDESGRAHYDLKSERGTILRIDPAGTRREIVATGIRFPVALGFNSLGDLFCTDQEGATWLPNGNPFDELLWIRPGRHYGFPPRHARHLPNVVDEPSTFDYSPQHQSTCGFIFNESVNGGPVFGPDWWRGNALVCGYSRGKLFRTELLKTRDDYLARNQTIAVFDRLPVDCCVAPDGALVVATHGGLPDWGNGPEGDGRLYKIRYEHKKIPQPVMTFAAAPSAVSVVFDRRVEEEYLLNLSSSVTFESAPSARAGDRLETLRPGYAVVAAQMAEPRHLWISRGQTQVSRGGQVVTIETNGLADAIGYSVTMPWPLHSNGREGVSSPISQRPEMDLGFDLCGLTARLELASDAVHARELEVWLPLADLEAARLLTRGSDVHGDFWSMLERANSLTLSGQLLLDHLLRPSVQPGAQIDDTLPPEQPELVWEAARPFSLQSRGQSWKSSPDGNRHRLAWTPVEPHLVVPFELQLEAGENTALSVRFRTDDDSRLRPLALRRFLLPWARVVDSAGTSARPPLPEALASGSQARGRQIFLGAKARCALCHTVRGEGGGIGPDLSNLVDRDYDSVLRDITRPNAALNPDHLTYSLALTDGRVLSGTVREEDDMLVIGDASGQLVRVARQDIEELRAVSISTMPEGLLDELAPDEQRDLLTFLLKPPSTLPHSARP